MPHIFVKLRPGKPEQQKTGLPEAPPGNPMAVMAIGDSDSQSQAQVTPAPFRNTFDSG